MSRKSQDAVVTRASPKEQVADLLQHLPDESTLEDIQYAIYVREVVGDRLKAAPTAKLITPADAKRRMAKWLGK